MGAETVYILMHISTAYGNAASIVVTQQGLTTRWLLGIWADIADEDEHALP